MKTPPWSLRIRIGVPLLALFPAVLLAAATEGGPDPREHIDGQWALAGTQTNKVGTPEERTYKYSYERRWALHGDALYVNGQEYEDTRVGDDFVEATYGDRGGDDWKTVRIRFIDANTVDYTEKGKNFAFGSYSVKAKGTRVER